MMTGRLRVLPMLLLVLSGCLLMAWVAHFWITDRLGVLRLLYPAQAVFARASLRCSPGSPLWLERVVRRAIDKHGALSNQVAYADALGRVHHCESGWQGRVLLSPKVAPETRYRFASLSKLFTADAILQQAAQGRLKLDDRLIDWLPELTTAQDERVRLITLHHLLTHQAGFDRLRSPDPMFKNRHRPWCPYETVRMNELHLDFAPGERYAYSNLGYCLLGVVLERITGEPFRQWLMRQYALEEAGIRFVDGEFFADEVRYDFRNSPIYGEWYSRLFDFRALSSSAGLSGNARALVRQLHAMLQRQSFNLISDELPVDCDTTVARSCFGYAFYPLNRPGESFRIHVQAGLLYGVSALAVADSERGVLVWLGNGMSRGLEGGTHSMAEHVLELLTTHYRQAVMDE